MRLKSNIALSESGFLFNPGTGDSFSVNPIGLKILEMMKEGKAREAIQKELLQHYEVEPSRLEEDFDDFGRFLTQLNLVEDA